MASSSDSNVLVIGAGPAGLSATKTLTELGYEVSLVDAGPTLGERLESLPNGVDRSFGEMDTKTKTACSMRSSALASFIK